MKSAEDGNRMEKKRKDEKEIICQKRWTKANMERITNNYLFFKTGFFFSRDEKVQKTRQQTGESTSFNE